MTESVLTCRLIPYDVHAEVIGGQALIISFKRGFAYTVRGAGVALVKALKSGPVDPIRARAAFMRIGSPEKDGSDFDLFLDYLKSEGLVQDYMFAGVISEVEVTSDLAFETIYVDGDLKDLLLMDPIHGAENWPSRT